MDQINSNPYFNSARLYQNQMAQPKPAQAGENAPAPVAASQATPSRESGNDYSSLFDDDSLLKLQSNLEAIAQMAEQSLKQIDN